jgi:hypothetical protein
MMNRPWLPPGRHWADRPDVIAGKDELAGGTWLGINETGVVAAVMNREGTLGPADTKRSRGELPLEALDHADAAEGAAALSHIDTDAYRPFNLLIADSRDAFWLKATGDEPVAVAPLGEGISMLTAHDLNDLAHDRIATYLPRFEAAQPPDPETSDWGAWEELVASTDAAAGAGPRGAMAVTGIDGYGTLSGSLIAIPVPGTTPRKPVWRFCAGTPGTTPWRQIAC